MAAPSTPCIIPNPAALAAWVGREVACSEWVMIGQDRIARFAEVTGDRQWIHTDPARAARESPYKAVIAHGCLTLSLLPPLFAACLRIEGVALAVNYGFDRVRFPAPVVAGQRVRGRLSLERLTSMVDAVQAHWLATVDIEHGAKPACVAQMLVRYYTESGDKGSTWT